MNVQLLEVLACSGCIMGPGVSNNRPMFNRRASVSSYVQEKMKNFDKAKWEKNIKRSRNSTFRENSPRSTRELK